MPSSNNAGALTRDALKGVLELAPDPERALAVLAEAPAVAPTPPINSLGLPAPSPSAQRLPYFSEVSQNYIDMRIEKDGIDHPEIKYLVLRRRTFLDIVDDRPVNRYLASDLQTYVSRMQYWPANATKRGAFEGMSTLKIIEANKNLALKPLARKTLADGYIANIRTMMRYGIADHAYRDPFAGVKSAGPRCCGRQPRAKVSASMCSTVYSTQAPPRGSSMRRCCRRSLR